VSKNKRREICGKIVVARIVDRVFEALNFGGKDRFWVSGYQKLICRLFLSRVVI
jgi:hypothetical protein